MADWVRMRGRDDYAGPRLYVVGDEGRLVLGHPLIECWLFVFAYRLGMLRSSEITGRIREMRVLRRDEEPPS